jgi:DNA-binding response OmpR family regulator
MTILIVDADPSSLATNARLVFDAGYHVVTATSFEDASAKLGYLRPGMSAMIASWRVTALRRGHPVRRSRVIR